MSEKQNAAELAEKVRKDALVDKIKKVASVKLADLDGKFVVIKDVTDYGDLFNDMGDQALIFGIKDGYVYQIKFDKDFENNIKDVTKGKLVTYLDKDKSKINWLQDHVEQQPFESYNSLRSSKFVGDAGVPLLEALEAYIHGTYNISGYDTRLVTLADLVADLKEVASASGSGASSAASSASDASSSSAAAKSSASAAKPASADPAADGKKADK